MIEVKGEEASKAMAESKDGDDKRIDVMAVEVEDDFDVDDI